MKLWIFRFTDPTSPYASARVAAPIRDWAYTLLGADLGQDVGQMPGVICDYGGETGEIGVLRKLARVAPELWSKGGHGSTGSP